MSSDSPTISIKVNEQPARVARGWDLGAVRDAYKPEADILIRNGCPQGAESPLAEGDAVVLIRRGEQPTAEELEALMTARHGPGVHARVKRARVGIAGCGGLGSAVAVALGRLGVGALRLVDFDVVEPSNLNRQQFFVDQIGCHKAQALAQNLARINPYVALEPLDRRITVANAAETFESCDVVAECFDDPAAKRDLTVAMRRGRPATPLVTVSGIAGYGPSDEIQVRRVLGNVWLIGDGVSAAAPGLGLLAPRVAVAAGHQANVILRILLGEES